MKNKIFMIAVVMAFISGAFQPLYSQETITADIKKKVKAVVIRGNDAVPTDVILPLIRTKVGDYFDEKALKRDAVRIMELGEFEVVELEKTDVPGGYHLLFKVEEVDLIVRAIKIKGNIKTQREEVRSRILLSEGDRYNYRLLQEDIARVYNLKKFQDVKVVKRRIPGGLELNVVVTESANLADQSTERKSAGVELYSLPSKSGVPYVRSQATTGFSGEGLHDLGKVSTWSSKPDYYVKETYLGPGRGPLMLSIGATHNIFGSK